ncbi:TATA binding protein associated factor 4-like protein [Encephalitozoon hellem]|uniref:Transcription initiation factor TFIID subunit 4 n=1 Tax=Encephalitozoon hellem TaxID=27973 RepID=A0A9Q9CBN3_ENCHE|nr:TATA binding protein associated factor 4-like protein [Encephalitozoon hellem ATCC 50504]AFM98921.1 TATA binding protein associated factor 4-like protein [Encephalitozoon hellem ATCC 50504]KAG5858749.1 TATA binding protein associated factor 4-like protein [Encephalitozoon hellem]UTX43933.1 TAF4 transcription initiation factor TFIID component [Encephalitozoon hellem]WEL39417.1 TAF4 transcription initiation factor TFIID component [Encephalitozoon hellem]|eukprot:XP_003887902.1 TATA binding protein associated factor 4-like protein [Encephalitozoon hellem ATCC 50504]
MNKEAFERLPQEKKKIIETAYFSAVRKEISASQFFGVCKEALTKEQFESLFSNNTPNREQQEEMKTEHLQDIIQYSGVDLKEEAEHIVRETETNINFGEYDEEDTNEQIGSLLNVPLFREFVARIGNSRRVGISEESFFLLFQVVRRKILDIVEKMEESSKWRVEYNLSEFIIRINNDLSRQLWCLEQIEKAELEKFTIRRGEEEGKKKVKKTIQEREDLVIKKRLSNTVALAALGVQQKSWMNAEDVRVNEESTAFNSIYSPFDEKALERKVANRTITMKDLLYVLERDRRYNKSIFTIQHYFR